MKLEIANSSSVINKGSTQTSVSFKIANSSNMFQILSSGLYADKITAVLREIGCNAFDAHIVAGCPERPFDLQLPTESNSEFYIQDYGPGLSPDEIYSIYTTYGVSTKQECDEQIGGFGLGSKSPFAYTLQSPEAHQGFTIISAHQGIQNTYIAHLNEEGAPVVSLLHTRAVDPEWPSGLKVAFNVLQKDFHDFQHKALAVFSLFNVAPRLVHSQKTIELAKLGDSLTPSIHYQLTSPYRSYRSGVLMANVYYPLQASLISSLSPLERQLLNSDLIFNMPNGSIQITPSRERLQYTSQTVNLLVEKLRELKHHIIDQVHDNLNHAIAYSPIRREQFVRFTQLMNKTALSSYISQIDRYRTELNLSDEQSRVLLFNQNKAQPLKIRLEHSDDGKDLLASLQTYEYRLSRLSSKRKALKINPSLSTTFPFLEFTESSLLSPHFTHYIVYDEENVTRRLPRLKHFVETSPEFSAYSPFDARQKAKLIFLTTPATASKVALKGWAESIASQSTFEDFDVRVCAISELQPPKLANNSSSRAALSTSNAKAQQGDFLSLSKNVYSSIPLSQMKEPLRFYIQQDLKTNQFFEQSSKHIAELNIPSSTSLCILQTLAKMYNTLTGVNIEQIHIMYGRNKTSKASLERQGYKPFLSTVVKEVMANWPTLLAQWNLFALTVLEESRLNNMKLGQFLWVHANASDFWPVNNPLESPKGAQLNQDLTQVAQRINSPFWDKYPTVFKAHLLFVASFLNNLTGMTVFSESLSGPVSALGLSFLNKYPKAMLLDPIPLHQLETSRSPEVCKTTDKLLAALSEYLQWVSISENPSQSIIQGTSTPLSETIDFNELASRSLAVF